MPPAPPRVISIVSRCSVKTYPRCPMRSESESSARRPIRILLLESGTGPGGSVNFIRDFVLHADHSQAQFIVGLYFANPSKTLEEIQGLGFPVVFFTHPRPVARQNRAAFAALFDGT